MADETERDTTWQETWAIVEIIGRLTLAGKCSEEVHFGVSLLRVDVPAIEGVNAQTKYFGGSAIYCVSPCSEAVARAVLRRERPAPISIWGLNLAPKALPEGTGEHTVAPSYDDCPRCGPDDDDEDAP